MAIRGINVSRLYHTVLSADEEKKQREASGDRMKKLSRLKPSRRVFFQLLS